MPGVHLQVPSLSALLLPLADLPFVMRLLLLLLSMMVMMMMLGQLLDHLLIKK
jgi:hypothetical protein